MIAKSAAVLTFGVTGWKSIGGQLLASGVLLLSGRQDVGLRTRLGAAFGLFMAMAFGVSALVSSIQENLRYAAVLCVLVLCCEILLILKWFLRKTTA